MHATSTPIAPLYIRGVLLGTPVTVPLWSYTDGVRLLQHYQKIAAATKHRSFQTVLGLYQTGEVEICHSNFSAGAQHLAPGSQADAAAGAKEPVNDNAKRKH